MKICVCGFLLLVVDIVVFEMFEKLGVKLVSKILYEKIWYFEIKRMISIFNGICFMFVEFLVDGKYLFRINYCVGV